MALWLGRQKEKEIMRMCVTHAEQILKAATEMRQVVIYFCDANMQGARNAFRDVFESERQADEIKRRVLEELSKGPFHPMDREDVMRLVLTVDDIGANAKSAARKINFSSPSDLGQETKSELKGLADMLVDIVAKMNVLISKFIDDPKEAARIADEIERLEEKIDDYRVELVVKIIRIGDSIKGFSSWLMLKEAVDNMENVADKSEDVADVIRTMVISHT